MVQKYKIIFLKLTRFNHSLKTKAARNQKPETKSAYSPRKGAIKPQQETHIQYSYKYRS
jgi:hypothetical protein